MRNTRVVDIINGLLEYNAQVTVWDPWVDPAEAEKEYGIVPVNKRPGSVRYEAIVLAVPHREFLEMGGESVRDLGVQGAVVFDVKSVLSPEVSDLRL